MVIYLGIPAISTAFYVQSAAYITIFTQLD